jgi:hypothetical protein
MRPYKNHPHHPVSPLPSSALSVLCLLSSLTLTLFSRLLPPVSRLLPPVFP